MKKKTGPGFNPYEIIFCPTSACNLKCRHCFVDQKHNQLSLDDSIQFLHSCSSHGVYKVGFSGGEPFLNLEYICSITKECRKLDLEFDRLMTNGVWWKSETQLEESLVLLRDSGFDGKIGLSWDSFHGQSVEKIAAFVSACHRVFNDRSCVEILSVIDSENPKNDTSLFLEKFYSVGSILGFGVKKSFLNKSTGKGLVYVQDEMNSVLEAYRFEQSFMPDDSITLGDRNWFTEDYCQDTGNVLYVHADGNIAPCCGFANECSELFIGTVKDDFLTLIKNAESNKIVGLCYKEGLLEYAKELQKKGELPKGKTGDMCAFCAWVCRNRS